MYSYLIDPTTDPDEQFRVETDGALQVNNPLDRETVAFYELKVWAVDNGKSVACCNCTVWEMCIMYNKSL